MTRSEDLPTKYHGSFLPGPPPATKAIAKLTDQRLREEFLVHAIPFLRRRRLAIQRAAKPSEKKGIKLGFQAGTAAFHDLLNTKEYKQLARRQKAPRLAERYRLTVQRGEEGTPWAWTVRKQRRDSRAPTKDAIVVAGREKKAIALGDASRIAENLSLEGAHVVVDVYTGDHRKRSIFLPTWVQV